MALIDTLREWQAALWTLQREMDMGGYDQFICEGSVGARVTTGASGRKVYVKLEFFSTGLSYETDEYLTFEEAQKELLEALGIAPPVRPAGSTWAPSFQLTDTSDAAGALMNEAQTDATKEAG